MSEKSNKNRIRELREGLGLSQEELSEKIDRARDTVGRIENGQPIKSDDLIKLAEIFGCSTDYILCRSDFRSPEREFIGNHLGFCDDFVAELEGLTEKQKYMLNESTNANRLFSDTISALSRYAYHSVFDYPNILPDKEDKKEKLVESIELTTLTKNLQDMAWWYRGCVIDKALTDMENDFWKNAERISGIKKPRT